MTQHEARTGDKTMHGESDKARNSVDVLAVMRADASAAYNNRSDDPHQRGAASDMLDRSVAARLAVAELLDAGLLYFDSMGPHTTLSDRCAAGRRFEAALARVTGEPA